MLRPSSLNLLKHCTGFIKVGADLERVPKTDAARLGDTAHDCLKNLLLSGSCTTDNSEMLSHVTKVQNYVTKAACGYPLVVEESVNFDYLYKGMNGTPDIKWFDTDRSELIIADLKYGMVDVEARNNWQLVCYASYYVRLHNPAYITLIILQPRVEDSLKAHTYTREQFEEELNRLNAKIHIANNTPYCSAGSHCAKCNSLWACSTASTHIINGMNTIGHPSIEDSTNLAAKLSLFREIKSLSKKKVDQLEAIVMARLERGERVTDIQIKRKKGKMRWTLDTDVVMKMLPQECIKSAPLTPKQMIDRKLVTKEFIESITKRGYSNSLEILTQEDYNKCLQQ